MLAVFTSLYNYNRKRAHFGPLYWRLLMNTSQPCMRPLAETDGHTPLTRAPRPAPGVETLGAFFLLHAAAATKWVRESKRSDMAAAVPSWCAESFTLWLTA